MRLQCGAVLQPIGYYNDARIPPSRFSPTFGNASGLHERDAWYLWTVSYAFAPCSAPVMMQVECYHPRESSAETRAHVPSCTVPNMHRFSLSPTYIDPSKRFILL